MVVGGKVAAERRMVRENDFRASGNGMFSYDNINLKAVKIACNVTKKAKFQSAVFDFVEVENANSLIIEMSYGFGTTGMNNAPGYGDSLLQ